MANDALRIIFMGTPDFAVPTLQALLDHHERVVAVVTQPDKPKGRGRKLAAPPVKLLAEAHNIPVLQPVKIRGPEFQAELTALKPDVIVVTAYGRILPGHILNLPPHGAINVHASLLPKYRGAAPIQWAIIRGETVSGVTIMQMDEGLDTGDILLPGEVAIAPDDTAATLAVKLSELGGRLIVETLDRLRAGTLKHQRQDDSQATLAPPLTKDEGRIDWQQPAHAISCQIRGLDPWPLAFTTLEGKWLRLFQPSVDGSGPEAPGTVLRADRDGLLIATGEGRLLARELQLEGGKRMAVAAFINGRPLPAGTLLGQ